MQTLAAEMVRRAQLHGLYTPAPQRVPTGLALHWLHPNPFGKDMRTDALTASDRLSYSERAKDLLRSSPMRVTANQAGTGKKLSASAFSGGIKLSDDDLVMKQEVRVGQWMRVRSRVLTHSALPSYAATATALRESILHRP